MCVFSSSLLRTLTVNLCLLLSAVTIGFEQVSYSASEPEGLIEVGVAVLSGELSTSVVVRIFSMDGTAGCELKRERGS